MRGIKRIEDIGIAREMRANGSFLPEICSKLGASKSSVFEWIKGIPAPKKERKVKIVAPRSQTITPIAPIVPIAPHIGEQFRRPKNNGRMKNGPYILVVAPPWFSGKKYRNRYCYEHHSVWEQHNGPVPAGMIVHHKNHDKHDNRIENLSMLSNRDHAIEHGIERTIEAQTETTCFHCKKIFKIQKSNLNSRSKKNFGRVYCTRSCQITLQQKIRWSRVP